MQSILIPENYPKIRRLPIGLSTSVHTKQHTLMPLRHVVELFSQPVVVEEKMDGKPTKFNADRGRFLVFSEDLKWMHSIYYKIPARYGVLDIFDTQRSLFLSRDEKADVFNSIKKGTVSIDDQNNYNFFKVAELAYGRFKMKQLPSLIGISKYAFDRESNTHTFMEGIVVKPSRSLFLVEFEHYPAKLVRKEFLEGITDSYLHKQLVQNEIQPNIK